MKLDKVETRPIEGIVFRKGNVWLTKDWGEIKT